MRSIGAGVIGWGFMGKTHTHAMRSLPLFYPGIDFQVRPAHVCSRRLEKAREAAELAGFARYTDDYRQLLADDAVDVVSICTPNDQHEEMAVAAARAGKHLYIDKPLAVTAESALRIARAAQEAGVLTQIAYNNRYMPAVMRMKQLAEEGALGDVLGFSARYLHSGSIDPARPIGWKQQSQGGVLLDLGSHVLDLLTWIVGYPEKGLCAMHTLYERRPTRDGGEETNLGEDHALITLQMKNGALGTVEASKISTGAVDELTLEIRGTKGAVLYDAMNPNFLMYFDQAQAEVPLGGRRGFTRVETVGRYPAPGGTFVPAKNAIGWDRGHIHCYYSFLDCVAHGKKPCGDVWDGVRLQFLMQALAKSAQEERWVSRNEFDVVE
ncbi:MAG: Gfo/Idh/MocA family oxidoreductase [Eubacteriales bacterium]|nr:Gfo/Idh/MocA family oxidoreductase [Eubacteriales bacterium]